MDAIIRKASDLDANEIEKLFNIQYDNFKDILFKKYKNFSLENYKNNWINTIINNEKLICLNFVDNNIIIGFIFLSLNEKENLIEEFHIIKEYQNDGKTFPYMLKKCFEAGNVDNDFCGLVFSENEDAKRAFNSIGAYNINGMFRFSYKRAKKWIEEHNI